MRGLIRVLATGCVVLAALPAQAGLITTAPAGGAWVDFDEFGAAGEYDRQIAFGGPLSVEVGGATGESITLSGSLLNVLGPLAHYFGDNGSWHRTAVGNAVSETGFFQFTFNDGPVAVVGGLMNYATPAGDFSADALIQALDQSGQVIESYNLFDVAPILLPGSVDSGEFRGISRAANDIHGFRIAHGYAAIDDLQFGRLQAVPEPATHGLLAVALLAAAWVRRRR